MPSRHQLTHVLPFTIEQGTYQERVFYSIREIRGL
jgi:hypothetical protein